LCTADTVDEEMDEASTSAPVTSRDTATNDRYTLTLVINWDCGKISILKLGLTVNSSSLVSGVFVGIFYIKSSKH
jgi:hypothetical protein